jgi:hypothetical protein
MSNRYIVLMHMFTGKKTKMEYKLDWTYKDLQSSCVKNTRWKCCNK